VIEPIEIMNIAASIPWLAGFVGSSLILSSAVAWAEPMRDPGDRLLLAQQVVDGLPPPPPVTGQAPLPSSAAPAVMPPASVTVPAMPTTAPSAAQRYLVLVNGDSPMLLSQIQAIEPGAFVQDYQGQRMIQAGLFDDSTQAQQRTLALSSRGIGAQVVTLPGGVAASSIGSSVSSAQRVSSVPNPTAIQQTSAALPPPDLLPVAPVPREVEFGQPAPATPGSINPSSQSAPANFSPTPGSRAFYVVVPGSPKDLQGISNQIVRLGDGLGIAQLVQSSTAPRGPHVRVGPFADRGAANRWSRYLRDFGMDARVDLEQ
jgi:hypothetical protein